MIVTHFPIPSGTPAAKCRGPHCGRAIYHVLHPNTRRPHPVSVNAEIDAACIEPTATSPGLGISHFADCPDAASFRKPKPKAGANVA